MTKRIYIVYPTQCIFVQQRMVTPDWCVPEFHFDTPAKAWAERQRSAGECGLRISPAEHVVVGADLTGQVNDRGAHECIVDWSDLHLPMSQD